MRAWRGITDHGKAWQSIPKHTKASHSMPQPPTCSSRPRRSASSPAPSCSLVIRCTTCHSFPSSSWSSADHPDNCQTIVDKKCREPTLMLGHVKMSCAHGSLRIRCSGRCRGPHQGGKLSQTLWYWRSLQHLARNFLTGRTPCQNNARFYAAPQLLQDFAWLRLPL
jgi:hypothetical protein